MEVREISNPPAGGKNEWESFLSNCKEKSFLQSWAWGEFQKKSGKIWRLGVFDKGELVAVALVSKIVARRGTFLLIQHGPDLHLEVAPRKVEIFKVLLEKLKEIGRQEGASFIRIAPILIKNEENKKIFQGLSFRKSPIHANAYSATWKLDLAPSEDNLLKNMRKTTRYLIKQAQKNPDITIEKTDNIDNIEAYQKLNREVAKRQHFVAFSDSYIENEFEIFAKDNQALLLFGKYKGEIVAGALIIFWSGIGFYHQAASLSKYAKLSVPYLLQWEAIKEAKNRGCKLYDFWGFTDPQKYPKHPWAGPTLFKMGFGGYTVEYVKTRDYVLSKKYWLTYIFETIRSIKRFGL